LVSTSATLEPATTYLDPSINYFSFMPFGGLTNQFIGVQIAAYIALKLNRTLILPPIVSNSHDKKNTHQRWSQYMDLPRLSNLTGLRVLEWGKIRPLSEAQREVGLHQALKQVRLRGPYHTETDEWAEIAENITCQIICGYGAQDQKLSSSAQTFMFHFLFRPVYVDPPLPPKTGGVPGYNASNPQGYLDNMEDLLSRYRGFDDRLPEEIAGGKPNILFLSHTFKINTIEGRDIYWKTVGQHMHFLPKLMEYVTLRINQEVQSDRNIQVLPNNDPEEVEITSEELQNPVSEDGTTVTDIHAPATRIPHIAVHLRRDDIWLKCRGGAMDDCIISFDRYAEAVEQAREYASKTLGLLSQLPVVVTSDTTSEEDLQKIKELGWHLIDHSKYGTTDIWGTFGPAMVDSAILAHADVLVGNHVSTMSRVARMRQREWYGHQSFFPSHHAAEMGRRVKRQLRQ
jgi:hypothetical protein